MLTGLGLRPPLEPEGSPHIGDGMHVTGPRTEPPLWTLFPDKVSAAGSPAGEHLTTGARWEWTRGVMDAIPLTVTQPPMVRRGHEPTRTTARLGRECAREKDRETAEEGGWRSDRLCVWLCISILPLV